MLNLQHVLNSLNSYIRKRPINAQIFWPSKTQIKNISNPTSIYGITDFTEQLFSSLRIKLIADTLRKEE